ncbi:MAG: hypothetical protein WA151_05025, partial [Desulfatirhabdiaceae bacterium]
TQKASGMNGPTVFAVSQHLFPRHARQFATPLNDSLQINNVGPKIMFPVQGFRQPSSPRNIIWRLIPLPITW